MSEDGGPRLTRETWRAGKHHRMLKRKNHYGGQTVAPAAFLEAGKRNAFKPGRPGYRVCSATKRDGTPCGMLAFKDLKVCGQHGGFGAWAMQGKLQSRGKAAAWKAARAAMPEGKAPLLPLEILKTSTYQQANQRTRIRIASAYASGPEIYAALIRQLSQQPIER